MKQMKLALVPAALALMSSATYAQMVVSGRVDLGVQYAPADLTKSEDNIWTQNESSNARLRFSGKEKLSNDLSAFFVLEHRFNADTGQITDNNAFWRDKAWLGMESKTFGEVMMGRVHSPQYRIGTAGRYEAFSGDSYASMGTRGARAANQWNNSVYYRSPSFGGFDFGVVVQAGEATRSRGEGAHLHYERGPLSATVSWQREQDPMTPVVGNTIDTLAGGAYYDFGVIRISGTYAKSTDVNLADTGDEVVYTVGARIPMGPGEFRTSYRKIDDTDNRAANDKSGDRDSDRYSIGYAYFMSKSTSINLSLVHQNEVRYRANGTTLTDYSGTGAEAALRMNF